ncbi:MAG: YkgJ family cysteine cluster protein [Thermoguttaceae bacterium]
MNRPWYHRGLSFKCTGCGSCCTGAPGYVWVNKAEIEALAVALDIDTDEFQRLYVRQIGKRKSLIELPGGDCVFFDNKRRTCRVYEARPRQCRTWPFWCTNLSSQHAWEQIAAGCAGCNHGPLFSAKEIQSRLR